MKDEDFDGSINSQSNSGSYDSRERSFSSRHDQSSSFHSGSNYSEQRSVDSQGRPYDDPVDDDYGNDHSEDYSQRSGSYSRGSYHSGQSYDDVSRDSKGRPYDDEASYDSRGKPYDDDDENSNDGDSRKNCRQDEEGSCTGSYSGDRSNESRDRDDDDDRSNDSRDRSYSSRDRDDSRRSYDSPGRYDDENGGDDRSYDSQDRSGSYDSRDRDASGSYDSRGQDHSGSYDSRGQDHSGSYDSRGQDHSGSYDSRGQDHSGSYDSRGQDHSGSYDSKGQDHSGSYDSRGQDHSGSYDSKGQDHSGSYDSRGQDHSGSYDSRSQDHSGSYDSRGQDHSGSYGSRDQDHSGSYDSRGQDHSGSYGSRDQDHSGSYDSRGQDHSGSYDSRGQDHSGSYDSRGQDHSGSYDSRGQDHSGSYNSREEDERSYDSREKNAQSDDSRSRDSRGEGRHEEGGGHGPGVSPNSESGDSFGFQDGGSFGGSEENDGHDTSNSIKSAQEAGNSFTNASYDDEEDYTSQTSGDDPVARLMQSGTLSRATPSVSENQSTASPSFAMDSDFGSQPLVENGFDASFETNDSSTKASVGSFTSSASEQSKTRNGYLPHHMNMLGNANNGNAPRVEEEQSLSLDDLREPSESEYESESDSQSGHDSYGSQDDHDQEGEYESPTGSRQSVSYGSREFESPSGRSDSNGSREYESPTGSRSSDSYRSYEDGSRESRSQNDSRHSDSYDPDENDSGHDSYSQQSGSDYSSNSFATEEESRSSTPMHYRPTAENDSHNGDLSFASSKETNMGSQGSGVRETRGNQGRPEVEFDNPFNSEPEGFGDDTGAADFASFEGSFAGSMLSKDEPLRRITEHSVEQSSRKHQNQAALLTDDESDESASSRDTLSESENSAENDDPREERGQISYSTPASNEQPIPRTVSDDEDESSRITRTYNGYTREQMTRLMNDPPPEDLGDGQDLDRSKAGRRKRWQRINCKSDELLDLVANVNDAMNELEEEDEANEAADTKLDSAPRLLLQGFEALVGILLQLSDELELMSTFARLKDASAKGSIRSLLAFAPVLDDIFADMKPILQHFLEEEIDEEMTDYLSGMNLVVDLLCELADKVGEKQEWNPRANTSFVTLLELLSRDLLEVVSIFDDVDTPRYEISDRLKDSWQATGHEEESKTLEVTSDLTLFRQLCYEVMLSTDQWCPDTSTLMELCGVDQDLLDEQTCTPVSSEEELAPTPEAALQILEKITGDPLPRTDALVSVIRRILPISAISDNKLVDKFASIRGNIRDPLGLSTSNLVSISSVPEVLNDPEAYGISGVGKTTLAAMVANHKDVRRHFLDGVVWIHIGPKELDYARYVQCMRDLISQLLIPDDEEEEEPLFPELLHTPGESKAKRRRREEGFMIYVREAMIEFLRDRNVLIILEDVCFDHDLDWFEFDPDIEEDEEEEEEFFCVVLVTSRCRTLLPAADTVEVDMLDEAEAVSLLIQESGKLPHDMMAASPETRAVVLECANHPLAVKSVGRWLNLKHATAGAVSSVEEIHEDVIKSMEKVLKSGGQQEGDMMYEILDMSLTPSMNGEPTSIIKFCVAAFVVVFCDRAHLSDSTLAESTPAIPLEIVKILFESLLDLEEETLLKEGSLFHAQKQEATELIPEALKALGILKEITSFFDLPDDEDSSQEEVEQKYLQLMHGIHQEYGEYLNTDDVSLRNLTTDSERRWNRAFSQCYLAQNVDWDSELPDAALDYALEQLPSHMIRGGLLAEAANLLSNETFVQGRLFAFGRGRACERHVKDGELLFDVLVEQRTTHRKKLEPKAVLKQAFVVMGDLLNMDEDEYIAEEDSPEALDVARCHFQLGFSLAEKRCWEAALSQWDISQELVVSAVGMVELVAGILFCVGVVYSAMNEYEQSLESLKQCLKIRRTIHGEEHILYAQTIQKIGDIFLAMSDYQEAMQSYNWALDVMHIEPSHHRIDIGDILENMGSIHFSKGELEDAVQCFQDALRSKQVDLGENHPELSTMYHHIGDCLSDQGKHEEAIDHLEEAVRLKEFDPEGDGERDADVLTITGVLYNLKGKQQEGLESYEKALQVLVTKVPHKKEKVASLLHLIGCVYLMNGEQKKAMKLFEESLQARRKVLGFVHLDVAATLFNMAFLHQSRNRLDKALKCLEEALKIRQLRLPDSEKVALTHERIGTLARTVGKSKKAENAFNDALRIRKLIHGESHETVATVLQELGDLMDDLGEYETAMKYYNEALEIRHQRLGDDDLAVAETLYSMGFTLQNKEASDNALACFEESLHIRTFQLGEDAKEVGDTLNMMGFLQANRGELGEALSLLWDALRIRKLQKDNIKVSETLKNIGNVHRQKEEFDLAIECYEECLRIRRVELGHENEKVADALIAIGNVYSDMDIAEDAKECYREALTIRTQCFGESDESVASVLQYMGTLEFRAGELDQALQLFTEFIRIRNGNNTDKDGDYVNVLFMMGNIHKMQHSEDDAQTCWTEAYEVFQALGLAEDNPEIAQVMGNLVNDGEEEAMPDQARDSTNVRRMLGKLSEKMKGTFNENKGRGKNHGHRL